MAKAFGINELLSHNFKHREMSEPWVKHIGHIERNSTIMILGPAKNGKTDYCLKLVKELAVHGSSVFYNSFEEGKSETLKIAVQRNNMQDVVGKVMFGNREPFDVLMKRMTSPRSQSVLLIDSWDYMKLTLKQFQEMRMLLKRKMIIIICWADGKRPDDSEAKKIEHQCDVIIPVRNFIAKPISRFGGNEPMNIKKLGDIVGQLNIFDHGK